MPILSERNVFDALAEGAPAVGVVFGYRGFNVLGSTWDRFRESNAGLPSDPFSSPGTPLTLRDGLLCLFIPARNGLDIGRTFGGLMAACDIARETGAKRVLSNGCAGTRSERGQKDLRARTLIALAVQMEQEYGVSIELCDLNNIYVRNKWFAGVMDVQVT